MVHGGVSEKVYSLHIGDGDGGKECRDRTPSPGARGNDV